MKLAFLFQYFNNVEVCKNRIKMLRRFNPEMPIYGLYGGDLDQADYYKKKLGHLFDDFYAFDENDDPVWRWVHMDLIIDGWYRGRGKDLEWDTIVHVHWDQLVLAPIKELFPNVKEGEAIFSGLRPMSEVDSWWSWLYRDRKKYGYDHYQDFLKYIQKEFNYSDEPQACQGLLSFLPRDFLDQFSKVPEIEHGYIEYRWPMYAQIFKTPICQDHTIPCWWPEDPSHPNPTERDKCMNASKDEFGVKQIMRMSSQADGPKLFHPYRRVYPLGPVDYLRLLRVKLFPPKEKKKHITLED